MTAAFAQAAVVSGAVAQSADVQVRQQSIDYDTDDDGLIEVSSLAQLDVVRWDLDGDGEADRGSFESAYSAAFPDAIANMGCPASGCSGYELVEDLDFDTDDSGKPGARDEFWNNGSGWIPIGTSIDKFEPSRKRGARGG